MLPAAGWRYPEARRGFGVAPAKCVSLGCSSSSTLLTQAFPYSVARTHACIHTHTCKHLPQPALLPPNCSSSCTRRQAGRLPAYPQQRAAPACTASSGCAPAPLFYLLRPVQVGTYTAAVPAKGKEAAHSFWRKPIHAVCSAERDACGRRGCGRKPEDGYNIPALF